MRNKIILLIVVLRTCFAFGQVSSHEFINYQKVVFDDNDRLIINKLVDVRLTITKDSLAGDTVYFETHQVTTNSNGLLSLHIGNGATPAGDFGEIDWSSAVFFLKLEIDPTGSTNYTIIESKKLLNNPFALFAKSIKEKDPVFRESASAGITSNDTMGWNNKQNKLFAGTNVSISGDTIRYYPTDLDTIHYVGELFGGGVVFWVDETGKHGLIASLVDASEKPAWSNIQEIGVGTTDEWNGAANTTAILNQEGHVTSAAKLCADYVNDDYGTGIFDDWYLPSIYQLQLLYERQLDVNIGIFRDGDPAIADLAEPFNINKNYWSSTESSSDQDWATTYDFRSGTMKFSGKSWSHNVRAIRSF